MSLIERLRANDLTTQALAADEAADRIEELEAENERLRAVYEAVKDIKWRSIDKDNMEFSTTCFAVDRIREALAAQESDDE